MKWKKPKKECVVQQGLKYLFEIPDAVLATEAFLLTINQQEMVGRWSAGQVVTTLLTAVHDQAIGPAVNVETGVAANLMSHGLKANLVSNLLTQCKGMTQRFKVKRLSGRRFWRLHITVVFLQFGLTSVSFPQTVHLVLRLDLGGFCLFSYAPRQPVLQNSWKDSLESTCATMVPFMFVMSLWTNTHVRHRPQIHFKAQLWFSSSAAHRTSGTHFLHMVQLFLVAGLCEKADRQVVEQNKCVEPFRW